MQKLKTTDTLVKSTVAVDTITATTFMKTCAKHRIIVVINILPIAVDISTGAITKQFDAIFKCSFVVTN